MVVSFKLNPAANLKIKNFETQLKDLIGVSVTNVAQRDSPIDTGRLRTSLHYNKIVNGVRVSDGVFYGILNEKGTVNQRATPFLFPAPFKAWPTIARAAPIIFKSS